MKLARDNFICNQKRHIRIQIIDDKLVVLPCCHLQSKDEKLDTIEDIDKIDDIYDYLENVYKKNLSRSFNINKYSGCKNNRDRCYLVGKNMKAIDVSISQACNLNCIHCLFKKTKKYDDIYFKVLNKLTEKEYELDTIYLTSSGEPFYYYDKTIDFLKKLNTKITKSITTSTNCVLLNKERIDELYNISKETNVKYELSVSIDGYTKETFKKIRNADLDKVLENTLYLKEKGMLKKVLFCTMLENVHELPLMKEFCEKNDISYYYCIIQTEDKKLSEEVRKTKEWKKFNGN